VRDLVERESTRLNEAKGLVAVSEGICPPKSNSRFEPRVTIGFPDGRVRFEQFVPDQCWSNLTTSYSVLSERSRWFVEQI